MPHTMIFVTIMFYKSKLKRKVIELDDSGFYLKSTGKCPAKLVCFKTWYHNREHRHGGPVLGNQPAHLIIVQCR